MAFRLTKQQFIIIFFLLVASGGTLTYLNRGQIHDWYRQKDQEPLPQEKTVADFTIQNIIVNKNDNVNNNVNVPATPIVIPDSINLAIPFTAQAPHANWNLPYQEACEEASILMVARFLQHRPIIDANDADQAILQLVDYNANTLHYPIDMTAEQTAKTIEQFYQLNTEVIYDFTWEDIKRALAQGYPVLVPAAGRLIGNPNYTAPGPLYHMLVIKGYTATKIITNDSGTRRGANYQYSYNTVYNAAHDWNNGDVTHGKKVIIIVKPAV